MATWIVGGALLLIIASIVWKMVSDRRKGKGGCDCAHCHGACSARGK